MSLYARVAWSRTQGRRYSPVSASRYGGWCMCQSSASRTGFIVGRYGAAPGVVVLAPPPRAVRSRGRRGPAARGRGRRAGRRGERPALGADLPLLPEVRHERDVAQGQRLLEMRELLDERAVELVVPDGREVAEQGLAAVGVDVQELDPHPRLEVRVIEPHRVGDPGADRERLLGEGELDEELEPLPEEEGRGDEDAAQAEVLRGAERLEPELSAPRDVQPARQLDVDPLVASGRAHGDETIARPARGRRPGRPPPSRGGDRADPAGRRARPAPLAGAKGARPEIEAPRPWGRKR